MLLNFIEMSLVEDNLYTNNKNKCQDFDYYYNKTEYSFPINSEYYDSFLEKITDVNIVNEMNNILKLRRIQRKNKNTHVSQN
ncbi:hypothetical protein Catovirus_1_543 [Catovirus CTV1]|uniref:Uncharacterized protein n=1 Tax=Catovirus CTV1 TaxID=1977631 RepID=A0A1V0S9X1_9VIRU|nr:hypothetical protein Catovirus_1_543 [Catovirus CTV1]